MENFTYTKGIKKLGTTYLGGIKHSAKMNYSYNNGTITYCLYLAPSNMAYGDNRTVCPNDKYCKDFCLNGSGRNKGDILSKGTEHSKINVSRVKKTKFFYEDRETFMQILIHEIRRAQIQAIKENKEFSVRLNGTSDISLLAFKYQGKNILEHFPNVQFYDYTKVYSRTQLQNQYPNYDLTLSYNGHNLEECLEYLNKGGKVAVVFENELPKFWHKFQVIDANGYDMRYLDPKGTIMGLHYHKTAYDYMQLKIDKTYKPNTKFIVTSNDKYCEY